MAAEKESGIFRVKKAKDYFTASNEPFNDERLSWEARGALGYLLSKPDGWEIKEKDLINKGPAKLHKVTRMIKELKRYGYIRRYRARRADGTFYWVSEVYESTSLNPEFQAVAKEKQAKKELLAAKPAKPTTTRKSTHGLSMSGLAISGKSGDIVSTDGGSTQEANTKVLKTESHIEKSNADFSSGFPTNDPQQPTLLPPSECLPTPSAPVNVNETQQGKGKGKPGRPSRPAHPNTQPIMDAYIESLGYSPANYAKESAAAKKMAEQGYTPAQVVSVYQTMKASAFYSDKFLSLLKVHEQIGETYPPQNRTGKGSESESPSQTKKYNFLNSNNLFS